MKGIDGLDETYRTDRDEIVVVAAGIIVFFCNMRHKPQIAFNEDFPGFGVAVFALFEIHFFLFFAKRRRKIGTAGQL